MAKIVRDSAGNIVTDPAILEKVLGAHSAAQAAKQAKVPTTVDVTPKVDVQAEDEAATAEATGGGVMQFARDLLSGEAIAKAPTAVADLARGDKPDGADKMRALEDARRHRGMTPAYRDLGTSPFVQKPIQFASNVAADAIGMVASKVALPFELGIQSARSAAEVGAGAVTDLAVKAREVGVDEPSNWLFGELSAKALEAEQRRGKYRTKDALERRAAGVQEFLKGAAFGISPAVYAAAEASARGENVADAAWDTFLAYPLASIVPFAHLGRLTTVGNKRAVSDGVQLATPRGEPIMVNSFGQKVIDKTGPTVQRLAFDAVPAKRVKEIRTTGAANLAMESPSPAAKNLANAIAQQNVLRDLEAELADPQFAGATEWQKFQAIEGTLGDVETQQAPVLDQVARVKAQALGESLVQEGMPVDVAQQAVPYVLFEGVRAAKAGMLADPMLAIDQFSGQLAQMQPQQRAQFVKSFEQVVKSRLNDPTFIAAADQAWSSPKGDVHWVPRSEVRQRDGYVEAFNRIKAADQAAGRPTFDLHIPELGELRKDYAYNLYSNLVDDLRSTPEGRERVFQLLRANPIARVAANPTASLAEKALATWSNQPAGARRKFVDAINRASFEIAQNMGVDPVVVAKHFDRYLSRSFKDALDGNQQLLEMINAMEGNPAQAVVRGFDKQGGRFKRKLTDKAAGTGFMDRVAQGEVDLHGALATTSATMMALSQQLHAMNEHEGVLRQNGALFDPDPSLPPGKPPRPGLVWTGATKAAPGKKAASSDPYNFVLGKLADKWVDPQIASALNLQIEAMPKAHAALQVWRWMKTVANVPKYQLTQFVNDNAMMAAFVGESRFTSRGRPIALKAQAAVDRYAAGLTQPNPQPQLVLSPEMRTAQAYGIVDLSGVAREIEALPPSVRGWATKQAMTIANQTIKAADPADAMGVLAQSIMHLKTGVSLPKTFLRAFAEFGRAGIEAESGTRISSAFEAAHEVLTKSTLSIATAMAEQQRRLQAFMFGKELLKLTDEQAAILASESVYGVEPSSMTMKRIMSSAIGQVALPPFLNFGIWQLKKTAQRALNDKALWVGHLLEQGVRAYEEEMQDDQGSDYWAMRMHDSMLRSSVAPDIGLNSAEDLADTLSAFGVSKTYTDMVRGGNGSTPYITMTLRDLGGYQSVFSNLDLRASGIDLFLSANPTPQTAAQLLDPQMRNPRQFGSGAPMGSMDPLTAVAGLFQIGFDLFGPTTVNRHGTFVGDMKAIVQGKQPLKYGGVPRNPVDVVTSLWGPFALNTIDRADTMERVSRQASFRKSQMAAEGRRDLKSLYKAEIPEPYKSSLLDKTQVNAWALQKQMELGIAYGFLGMDFKEYQQTSRMIDDQRREAVARAEKKVPNGILLAKWAQVGNIAKWIGYAQQVVADVLGANQGAEP